MPTIDLSAREEERVWIKRQTDGELDDSRLTEGLTGETTVYKRRGMERPEMGRPQIKYVSVSEVSNRTHQLTGNPRQAEAHPVCVRRQRFNASLIFLH